MCKENHPTILICVLMLPHIELAGILARGHQTSGCCQCMPDLCMWRLHGNQSYWFWAFKLVSTIKSNSSISSVPYHAPVFALFSCCSLKSCSSPAELNSVMALRLWLFYIIIIICFGYECQLNACKVKIQKLCSRHAQSGGQTNRWVEALKRTVLVFSLFFAHFLLCSLCIEIPRPLFSTRLHLFTCLVIVQSHCFYHLPTPLTDHAG